MPRRPAGFTLIELVVVLAIVGLGLVVAVPRLLSLTEANLRRASRELATAVRYLAARAVTEQSVFRLHYDLDRREYWITRQQGQEAREVPDPVLRRTGLPGGVRFRDVTTPRQGSVTEGEIVTRFTPAGWAEPTAIHLEDGRGHEQTVLILPFAARPRVFDRYVPLTPTSQP
ncbi:MAG: type II secretion system protein [Deltaproteobacteria bacterium]|nr:type II secretion system protein [Deltaproteobacteria bacterium]MBI3075405.1 type II secretion system protein [Deltaproteobacteria bacterium]